MSLLPLLETIASLEMPTDAQRVFHGRGGLHPGCEHLTLDSYPPVWVLTSFKPLDKGDLDQIHQALTNRWVQIAPGHDLNWVYQCRHEGAAPTRLMHGEVPSPHVVQENGARYLVHVLKGQNHGLFLDMAAGRSWVREHASQHPGLKVLNLFAYTGAFSVAALQGGAGHVLNVDMSAGATSTAQHNHALNGVQGKAGFLAHNIFNTWGKITRQGPYDLVVMDPPSYQKGSFVATKDYPRLMRRLPDLLTPGGHALLCLNAPELNTSFLLENMLQQAPQIRFVERLLNPPAFADIDAERALKVLCFQAPLQPTH